MIKVYKLLIVYHYESNISSEGERSRVFWANIEFGANRDLIPNHWRPSEFNSARNLAHRNSQHNVNSPEKLPRYSKISNISHFAFSHSGNPALLLFCCADYSDSLQFGFNAHFPHPLHQLSEVELSVSEGPQIQIEHAQNQKVPRLRKSKILFLSSSQTPTLWTLEVP